MTQAMVAPICNTSGEGAEKPGADAPMLEAPTFTAVICAVPLVAPCAILTVWGDSVILASFVSVTATPPDGAACERATVKVAVCPSCSDVLGVDNVMFPGDATVTLDVLSANPGALAVTTVVPGETPVTLKLTTWVPCETGSDGGTVAMPVMLDFRVKVIALGAGPERVNVRVPSPVVPRTVKLAGDNTAVRATVTCEVAVVRPGAVAVIVVGPFATPVIVGWRVGVVWPALKLIEFDDSVAFEVSLSIKVTVTGP